MKPPIDSSQWPVLIVDWPAEMQVPEDLVAHFDEIIEYAQRGVPFGIVIDMLRSGTPPAKHRRAAADCMRKAFPRARTVVGAAHVIKSPLVRGILTAVYWLSPPPFPTTVTATVREAVDWVQDRVRKAKTSDA